MLARPGQGQGDSLAVLDPAADAAQARRQMAQARREGEIARQRADKLEAKARVAGAQVEKTAQAAAAVAARIQQNEADIAARQARIALISAERERLRADLARRQAPLIRLTGSLQRLSRRPPLFALLRPGSVRDLVYMRAVLDSVMPEVEARTADLRADIARARTLEADAREANADLQAAQDDLGKRRTELAVLESRQRLASRAASGLAAREQDHALALGEQARDLSDLIDTMGAQGRLRAQLASLPGPVMKPADPTRTQAVTAADFTPPPQGLGNYVLPVAGRVVTGFGEALPGQPGASGLTLETGAQAQVVAPADGRVAYAGVYRGFGQIVIVEHAGGWTSLVTGLARLDVAVGDRLVAGSPLGVAGAGHPQVTIELRRDSVPVNPLLYIHAP